MRKVKWIFFAYLTIVALIVVSIAASFAIVSPRDPGTFYSTYASDIKTLDPAEIDDVPSSNIAGQIFECLYNYAYGKIPYTLIPELAKAMPEISADGKTYTIHLREGIHFYDPDSDDPKLAVFPGGTGPEVAADDFIYAWKRLTNFHIPNPNSVIFDQVIGMAEWSKYTQSVSEDKVDYSRDIPGLKAIDAHTIRISLVDPAPQLVFGLAHLPSAVVARAAVEKFGDKFRMHPVGTGPYALSFRRHLPQQRIILTENPIYRGKPDVDPGTKIDPADRLPRMKRVQLDYFDEDLPPWYMFRRGLLDISGIPKDTYGQAIRAGSSELTPDMAASGVKLIKAASPTVYYLGFNMLDPVVGKNKPLRQAMCMAVNREEFIRVLSQRSRRAANRSDPARLSCLRPAREKSLRQFQSRRCPGKNEAGRSHSGWADSDDYTIDSKHRHGRPANGRLHEAADASNRRRARYRLHQLVQFSRTG